MARYLALAFDASVVVQKELQKGLTEADWPSFRESDRNCRLGVCQMHHLCLIQQNLRQVLVPATVGSIAVPSPYPQQ